MAQINQTKFHQIWLRANGQVETEEQDIPIILSEVDSIRAATIIPTEMDLYNGVVLYDAESADPVNMPATKLCRLPAGRCIRGDVLFAEWIESDDRSGRYEVTFDSDTAEWIKLWAGGRCTICGRGDKAIRWQAFPISAGRCCEACGGVAANLRQFMGVDRWDQPI